MSHSTEKGKLVLPQKSGSKNLPIPSGKANKTHVTESKSPKKVENKKQLQQTPKNEKVIATTECVEPPQVQDIQSETYSLAYQGSFDDIPLKECPNFHLVNQTPQIVALCTLIRNKDTSRGDFVFFSDRLFRLLVEEALAYFPFAKWTVTTPTGSSIEGLKFSSKICGVSIMRAGESMEKALRECIPNVRIGKILVQRLEDGTAKPQHFYTKFPLDIAERMVILMDPMLATGGSALMALQSLEKAGVRRENIVFINMVAAPEGVRALCSAYPEVRTVSCVLDSHLNEQKYIVPGLGDFGDRYYGTC